MSDDIDIVVRVSDRSAAGLASADSRIEALQQSAVRRIEAINAREVRINADITQAESRLRELQAEARTATGERRVRIDADIASAEARLNTLRTQLAGLPDARTRVEVDVAQALLRIEQARRAAQDASRERHQIHIDPPNSTRIIGMVGMIGGAITSLIPVAIAASGAIAGIGAVVGVGLGAAVSGFSGIGDAMKAMGTKSAGAGASAASMAAQVRSANEQIISSTRQVTSAQQGVESSAHSLAQAYRAVESSERSYTASVRDAARAEEDLTSARQSASRQLQDLQTQTEDMALSQTRASLSVKQAKIDLDESLTNPRATALQRALAQQAYDESLQQTKNLQTQAARLAEDKAAADKKGVDGSRQVTDAQQAIIDANQRVKDSALAVAEANYQVGISQQKIVDAGLALQDAQRGLVNAHLAAAEAGKSAGGGVDALGAAMAKLTPEGREFARFLRGFVDGPLKSLRDAGQAAFLPGVQAGLVAITPALKALEPAFAEFSGTLGKTFGGAMEAIAPLAKPILEFANASLKGLAPLKGVLIEFGASFGAMLEELVASGTAEDAMRALVAVMEALLPVLPALIKAGAELMVAMGPGLTKTVEVLSDALVAFFGWVAKHPEFMGALGAAVMAVTAIFLAFSHPIALVVGAIAALVGGIVWFFTETKTGKDILHGFVEVMKKVGKAVMEFFGSDGVKEGSSKIKDAFSSIGESLKKLQPMFSEIKKWVTETFTEMWPEIKEAWEKAYNVIASVLEVIAIAVGFFVDNVVSFWDTFGTTILSYIKIAFKLIVGVFSGALEIIQGVLDIFIGIFTGDWKRVWEGVKEIFSGSLKIIKTVFTAAMDFVKTNAKQALTIVKKFFGDEWDDIVAVFRAIPGRLKAVGSGMFNFLTSAFKTALNYVIRAWNGLSFTIPAVSFAGINYAGWSTGPGLGHRLTPLEKGGVVKARPGGTAALIGEGGEDEVVAPLSKLGALGGGPVVLELHSSGAAIDDFLLELLRRAIRVRGGEVQVVLGQ